MTLLAAYVCMFISIALCLAYVVAIALHCRPIKYNYTVPLENPRYCFKMKPFVVANAALGITLDVLTWSLPHCVVWRLQLRLSHKIAVSAMFAFGLLCEDLCRHPSLVGPNENVAAYASAVFASSRLRIASSEATQHTTWAAA